MSSQLPLGPGSFLLPSSEGTEPSSRSPCPLPTPGWTPGRPEGVGSLSTAWDPEPRGRACPGPQPLLQTPGLVVCGQLPQSPGAFLPRPRQRWDTEARSRPSPVVDIQHPQGLRALSQAPLHLCSLPCALLTGSSPAPSSQALPVAPAVHPPAGPHQRLPFLCPLCPALSWPQ